MNLKLVIAALLGIAGAFLAYGFESVPVQVAGTALIGVGVLLSRNKEASHESH